MLKKIILIIIIVKDILKICILFKKKTVIEYKLA